MKFNRSNTVSGPFESGEQTMEGGKFFITSPVAIRKSVNEAILMSDRSRKIWQGIKFGGMPFNRQIKISEISY